MNIFLQLIFLSIFGYAVFLFTKNMGAIRRNILLGKKEDLTDQPQLRWKKMLLLALGQKKMFKKPLPAVLHLFVYAGFVIINIEILEIILDGVLGTHRLFAPFLGSFYPVLISMFEILAFTVWLACIVFFCRRNLVKVKRLNQAELQGFPKSDANAILLTEIILMTLLFTMNATDNVLQNRGMEHYHQVGSFFISGHLSPLFNGFNTTTLVVIERICWWLHIVGILAFLNYLPYSKHLHILLAFPNAYYARLNQQGTFKNMPEIQNEVKYMMQPELAPVATEAATQQIFGAKDATDLSWKNLLDAYACTECGRCTQVCPAHITGKLLSPRKIMMDTRDRITEIGKIKSNINGQFIDDGKTLLHNYISVEELRACTTCNACVEACPVSIEPLDIIVQLRRYLVMDESNSPQEWNMMFSNIENNNAPWKFSPEARADWNI